MAEVSPQKIQSSAFWALLAGVLGIAFAPILAKLALQKDGNLGGPLSPTSVAFWRMAVAAPIFYGFVILKRERAKSVARLSPLLILPGFFFAVDLGVWHWSFEFTSVANSTLEANFAVILVAAASWFWLKERFTWLFPVGSLLSVAGMVLLVGPSFQAKGDAWIGDAMGLSVALAYTGYQLSTKVALGRIAVNTLMAATSLTAAVFLGAGALLSPGRFFPATAEGWAFVVALALVSQVFGQGLIAFGMSRVPAGLASVILILQPVLAALLGWVFLGQALSVAQVVAGGLVVFGIYLARRGSLG